MAHGGGNPFPGISGLDTFPGSYMTGGAVGIYLWEYRTNLLGMEGI